MYKTDFSSALPALRLPPHAGAAQTYSDPNNDDGDVIGNDNNNNDGDGDDDDGDDDNGDGDDDGGDGDDDSSGSDDDGGNGDDDESSGSGDGSSSIIGTYYCSTVRYAINLYLHC